MAFPTAQQAQLKVSEFSMLTNSIFLPQKMQKNGKAEK